MFDIDANALNEQLKATAAAFNAQHTDPTLTDEENQARLAAAELNTVQGSMNHDGEAEVKADTPESIAAAEKAKADAAAEEAAKETPEAAAVREAEEALAAARKAAGIEEPAEVEDKSTEADTKAEWISTDNKEFNAALGLMKASGMTPTEAGDLFGDAISTGDLTQVDHDVLVEKVGEDKAALIMAGFTNYVETEGQAALAATKAAHDAVGGSENWAKMVTWARGKAAGDDGFKEQVVGITAMLNSGNAFQADMAATKFKELFNADKGNSTITKATDAIDVTKATAAPSVSVVTPLSAREYAEKVAIADRLRGPARGAEITKLSRGRAAGRAQGM